MPIAPLKHCLEPGCPARVEGKRCPAHTREKEQQRGTAAERGYDRTWDKRAKAFRLRYPLCGMRPGGVPPVMSQCHEQGLRRAATQTDHVVPHRGDQALFWDENNWQALCASCGGRKSKAGL